MRIGASLFLIAAGAVLRFAITRHTWHSVNVWAVGNILMVVGAVGLVLTAIFMMTRQRTDIIQHGPVGPTGQAGPTGHTTYIGPPNDRINAPY
jgi:hypothetical protein